MRSQDGILCGWRGLTASAVLHGYGGDDSDDVITFFQFGVHIVLSLLVVRAYECVEEVIDTV